VSFSQKKFDISIWGVVSNITPGCVMSYGEVARAAGFPRHARMVSKAMSRSTVPLPWHRVIKSDRTIAFKTGSKAYLEQKNLLENEDSRLINGKVVPLKSDETIDLDKLLWGPGDN
jgi:methylated-DNA-protein-cysteine methyltransferase related protein